MININKTLDSLPFLAFCIALSVTIVPQVHAQEVEEVVVEAERSENALVNELSSASVLDGEKLADAGIENVEDVAAYVPNLVLAETSTGTNIVIRGIGAGVNQGFDQSVGLYVDGVPLPRSQMARAPFLDLAGVQILRGPQYVKDGNYSIAGSVHMITRAAIDEFELDVDFTTIPSQSDNKILITMGTPLTDKLGMRLAVQRQVSDGYVENVTLSEDGPASDNLLIRSVFNYRPTDGLDIKLKYEKGIFDTSGRQIEIIESQATPDFRLFDVPADDDPLLLPRQPTGIGPEDTLVRAAYFNELDFTLVGTLYDKAYGNSPDLLGTESPQAAYAGRSYLQVLSDIYTGRQFNNPDGTPAQSSILGVPFGSADVPPPAGLLDSELDFKRAANEDEFSNNESDNITLNVDYRWGDHTLSFVGSDISYEVDERIDTDFTPVPILVTDQSETYDQQFFRVDYVSPADAFVQISAGASYLDSELEFSERIGDGLGDSDQDRAAQILVEDLTLNQVDTVERYYQVGNEANGREFRPFLHYFGRTSISFVAPLEIFDVDRQFAQDNQITAAFLEAKFNWNERFRTTVGLRYTHSEKSAVRDFAYLLSDGDVLRPGLVEPLFDGNPDQTRIPPVTAEEVVGRRVASLGFIFNFQPHTDRLVGDDYPLDSSVTLNSDIPGCEDQFSYALGGPCDPDPANGPRREEQLLPGISFEYDVTPDMSVYASVQMANKLGGFDARSTSTPQGSPIDVIDPGTFAFEDEDAITYEIGTNWFLPGGWGELRAAAFYTDFTNLQVSAADRSVGQNVRNASEATTLGVEVEGLLQVSDRFNVNYSLAWIQFEFGDYPLAACAFNEQADGILITNASPDPSTRSYGDVGDVIPIVYELANLIPENNPFGSAPTRPIPNFFDRFAVLRDDVTGEIRVEEFGAVTDPLPAVPAGSTLVDTFGGAQVYSNTRLGPRVCQFEGRTNQYVADVQGTFTFNYRTEIPSLGIMLKPTLDVLYNSGYETTVRQDSDVAQGEYVEINGRLAISSLEDVWEVAIIGQNLTNEEIVSFASEVPIATRIQGSKTHFGFVRPPRSLGINFRYKFY